MILTVDLVDCESVDFTHTLASSSSRWPKGGPRFLPAPLPARPQQQRDSPPNAPPAVRIAGPAQHIRVTGQGVAARRGEAAPRIGPSTRPSLAGWLAG